MKDKEKQIKYCPYCGSIYLIYCEKLNWFTCIDCHETFEVTEGVYGCR